MIQLPIFPALISEPNKLWKVDEELFARMKGNYQSEDEEEFFEVLHYKQIHEFTCANDLILSEVHNEDKIYLVRIAFDEYELGHGEEGNYDEEFHTMNLSEVLDANLKELGYLDRDITFFQWLRERDYRGVMYDHNYDWV